MGQDAKEAEQNRTDETCCTRAVSSSENVSLTCSSAVDAEFTGDELLCQLIALIECSQTTPGVFPCSRQRPISDRQSSTLVSAHLPVNGHVQVANLLIDLFIMPPQSLVDALNRLLPLSTFFIGHPVLASSSDVLFIDS
ncbi:hypothetical protein TYRP_021645 [Tyrophagus putrescentiae]|nr:hypothetical protein TYRP_021645 [Tyrophagus putrescentiae]